MPWAGKAPAPGSLSTEPRVAHWVWSGPSFLTAQNSRHFGQTGVARSPGRIQESCEIRGRVTLEQCENPCHRWWLQTQAGSCAEGRVRAEGPQRPSLQDEWGARRAANRMALNPWSCPGGGAGMPWANPEGRAGQG